jgi:anti-sigma regulatory factor (Ser/Thr protein kinase)
MAAGEHNGASALLALDPGRAPHTHLELGALPTAVPCARLHAKHVLREWHLDDVADTAELIVSELVTNAVRASAGLTSSEYAGRWAPGVPPVRMWLASDGENVVVQVWDASGQMPVVQHPGADVESGRGLELVEALASDWGCYTPDRSSGKIVWAVMSPSAS